MRLPFQRETPDPLLVMLAKKYDAVAAKAREQGGVDKADLEALESLAKFRALSETAKPKKPNHLVTGVVLLLTLGGASFLMFSHVGATEIELETVLTAATFRTSEPTALMAGWKLKSVGVSGSDEVSVPAMEDRPAQNAQNAPPFRLSVVADEKAPGSVSMAPIHVGKSTLVTLTPASKESYRMHLKAEKDAPFRLEIYLHGAVRVDGFDAPPVTTAFRVPKNVIVKAGATPVDIDLEFVKESDDGPALLPMLPVDRLGLWRVEEFSDGAETRTRVVSSLISGTLFFEALNGQQRKLRENEELRPSGLRGVIRSARLKPDTLALRYDGEVRGLLSGADGHAHNLMPSWLEFLKAQRPVELLWGTAMYLFGIVMAGLKWLKVKL